VISSLWAVQPVPKNEKSVNNEKPAIKIQISDENNEDEQEKTVTPKSHTKKNDQFIDLDSNNVNDQREDDLLKIKQLKTKFKDLLKKNSKEVTPKNPSKANKGTKK
jgi:hypothetical protein